MVYLFSGGNGSVPIARSSRKGSVFRRTPGRRGMDSPRRGSPARTNRRSPQEPAACG
jgi:hypothetical protein